LNTEELGGYAEAVKRYRGNLSPRAAKLIQLESYVKCTQYNGRPSWWSVDVPLQERAPCVVYPVVRIAIHSNVDMVLGEGRYPEITTKVAEDEGDEDNGLSLEESKTVDRFIREYHRVCRFKSGSRESFAEAQGCGSIAAIHGIRNGKPFQDLIPAKWCEPEIDSDGAVTRLVIQYPYIEQYQDTAGSWCARTKLYRRVIDDSRDVEFFPADAPDTGTKISWRENPKRSVDHGLGFCPVVWYPFMRGAQPVNVVDGQALHTALFAEIEAHDFAISMRHRAAIYSGDPQVVEIGVERGYNPSSMGRMPMMPSTPNGGVPGEDNPVNGSWAPLGGQVTQARKRGATTIWQYEEPETKVSMLLLPSDALKAIDDNAKDIRIKLQESLAVVFLDPENVKFAATTSGKALQAIKQRQLDRCDQYRDDFGDRYFDPSVSMQLRIAAVVLARGEALRVPGAKDVAPILKEFIDGGEWQAPTLQIIWGDYFKPDPDEQLKLVTMVTTALSSPVPVITTKLALRKLQDIFNIENIAAIEEELDQEVAERDARELAKTEAEHSALHDLQAGMNADRTGASKASGRKPQAAPTDRSSSNSAATKT